MINAIIVADFDLKRTGILSTASNLLANLDDKFNIYSDQVINIEGKNSFKLDEIGDRTPGEVIIFTHIECKKLPNLIKKYPRTLVHVGDWPGNYWNSLKLSGQKVKGLLGDVRFRYRILSIPNSTKLVFVSPDDTTAAIEHGYMNASTIEIGVDQPSSIASSTIDCKNLIFTGNFRYAPNKLAANELIKFSKNNKEINLLLVGYYANELNIENCENIKCYPDVESIINFLNENRCIYISPIRVGAGAKNKILEAVISGCPVIATHESIDPSLEKVKSIQLISDLGCVDSIIDDIKENLDYYLELSEEMRDLISSTRSWKAMSIKMREMIDEA